ncbi:hypothetical protein SEA_SARBEAR_61 [Microbacterium phage SarBear]
MANEVPAPEEPRPIEHYIGAAIVTALDVIQEIAPVLQILPPEAQNEAVHDIIHKTAATAGETVRAHYEVGKVAI